MNEDIKKAIKEIKQTRNTKTSLENTIYTKKLDLFNLQEKEKKNASKETSGSKERDPEIINLRKTLANSFLKINNVDKRIISSSDDAEITNLKKERTGLLNETNKLRDRLAALHPETDTGDNVASPGLQDDMEKLLREHTRIVEQYDGQLENFFTQFTIEQLTGHMDDNIPVLLFPVKIETKFHETPDHT